MKFSEEIFGLSCENCDFPYGPGSLASIPLNILTWIFRQKLLLLLSFIQPFRSIVDNGSLGSLKVK